MIIVCRDDDAHNAPSFNTIRKAVRGWIANGLDICIATPWAEQRGDKSDFNDVIRLAGCSAVADRINIVLDQPDATERVALDEARLQLEKFVSLFFSTAETNWSLGPSKRRSASVRQNLSCAKSSLRSPACGRLGMNV
jgi:hypothetical protein